MIRIGFDASRAFTKERTGTENYSYQLLKALAKIDHRNQYLVYIRPQLASEGDALGAWPGNFAFKQINWPRFWTQGGLAWGTFRDDLDVLFVPAHTLPLIRRPGLKTVVTVHDLGAEYLPGMHQLKQRLYLNFMTRYQLKSVTHLIAVSRATKDDLIKRAGIKPDKISVIYEGFDDKLFKPVKGNLLPTTYYLFVGTVQPRKNLERVIKAFKIHLRGVPQAQHHLGGGIKLIIAGSKGWMSDKIYKLPKKLGIKDEVKFLGYVPDKDLPALYSGAIALVFPSLFEGFGLPILEAQACGCPVITSNISSMPEVAGDGAVLVDPYSVDDIVNSMRKMENGRWRMEIIKKGFENVKRFSWEKCAKETLKVLENL